MLTDETRQRDFPALAEMTYLNTAAESIPPVSVHEALAQYARDKGLGMRGRVPHNKTMEACREVAARMVGLQTEEVSFCSCSSEAYNLLANALNLRKGDEVVITDLDFPAGATPWLNAAEPPQTRLWAARDGLLDANDLPELLNERTRLVQVSLVSFYNGHRIEWAPFIKAVRAHAPQAIVAADVTQALGRVELDCTDFDILISSTHKWSLGVHGGCVVGVPENGQNGRELTTHAGGWFHLQNAFEADRFERTVRKPGAASFSVGMPNYSAIYALNAALRYLESVGVDNIATHADPLVAQMEAGLRELGQTLMAGQREGNYSGILAIRHERADAIHAEMEAAEVHVMNHAGRLRIALHGYNTAADVDRFLEVLRKVL
jgi:cysteine desulfurase/selenocysteine lyase